MSLYNSTKIYPLTSSEGTLHGIMSAAQAHWGTAPGLWRTKEQQLVAGEAITIEEKSSPSQNISIRRLGLTQLAVTVAPDADITSPGSSASSAVHAGSTASPEGRTGNVPAYSRDFIIVECTSAVFMMLQNTSLTYFVTAIHAGEIIHPLRPGSDPARGITGHGHLVGSLSTSGAHPWSSVNPKSWGSRVRVFDTEGVAHWVQICVDNFPHTTSGATGSASADGQIMDVRPLMVRGINVNGAHDLNVGTTIWFGSAPISGTFPNLNPRNIIQTPSSQAWLYMRDSASVTGLVCSWERTKNPE